MKITRLKIISWEPAILTFKFRSLTKEEVSEFKKVSKAFLRERKTRVCSCMLKYVSFVTLPKSDSVQMSAEWVCEKCIQQLADLVMLRFPNLTRVEFGLSVDSKQNSKDSFIRIEKQEVELENGKRSTVGPFKITRKPISVFEFARFVEATKYKTTAEQKSRIESFRMNGALYGLPIEEINQRDVVCVSLVDANAFCLFSKCRLPTEQEWLASAVADRRELDIDAGTEFDMRLQSPPEDLIISSAWDLTGTLTSEGQVVIRSGPLHFIKKGWREPDQLIAHRQLITPIDYDIMIGFRVVIDV